jgi:hypothetical protein
MRCARIASRPTALRSARTDTAGKGKGGFSPPERLFEIGKTRLYPRLPIDMMGELMPNRRTLIDCSLPFGQYRGCSLIEVFHKDESYCRWLSKQNEWLPQRYPEIAALLEALLALPKEKKPQAAQPRRAQVSCRLPRQSPDKQEKQQARTWRNAKFLSEYLTDGKISPGVCYAFLKLNQIADKHDMLDGERIRCLRGINELQGFDDDLLVAAVEVLPEFDHGFRRVCSVTDILDNLEVAARAQTDLNRLLRPRKPQKRQKIILKRPV